MGSLKSRLNLYSPKREGELSPEKGDSGRVPASPVDGDLQFGSFRFQSLAEGVYSTKWSEPSLTLGRVSLENYRPYPLSGILELAVLPGGELIHPEDLLFLDTETTGLSRGTGTLPFLTGLAYFEGERLVVEQIYLHEPGGEESYLDVLKERLERFPYLVTYNGKSFDMPLIRNRMILNRKRAAPPLLHFDLLHIFRRLLAKGSVPGHRQGDLESFLLGYERSDDVSGSEIPQIYFDYKKYDVDGGMERIFRHNRLDMMGMVLLYLEGVRIYNERDVSRPAFRSGLARILVKNRNNREALEILERQYGEETGEPEKEGGDRIMRYRDLLFLATLYRREGEWNKSAGMFSRLVRQYGCPYSAMALARIYEHRFKEYDAASELTLGLLDKLASGDGAKGGAGSPYTREELELRLTRLRRKIASRDSAKGNRE